MGDDTNRDDATAVFESARPRLRGIAYRMLGVVADADDVVQDAWLRWSAADRSAIERPDAWLNTVTSRLAIDRLRRRTREQEAYVGPWLPEPVVSDPGDAAELADSLTLGFLTMLERLTPAERAALLLVDVFGEPFATVADVLDRSPDACRQLAVRARGKVRVGERADADPPAAAREVVDRFLAALATGDESTALGCLDVDVDLVSDGGGARHAARRPIVGRDRVGRFMLNIARRVEPGWRIDPAAVGGLPGVVVWDPDDGPVVIGFEVAGGRIRSVRSVLNPEKLTAVIHPSDTIR